jgi:hypothetical protein
MEIKGYRICQITRTFRASDLTLALLFAAAGCATTTPNVVRSDGQQTLSCGASGAMWTGRVTVTCDRHSTHGADRRMAATDSFGGAGRGRKTFTRRTASISATKGAASSGDPT